MSVGALWSVKLTWTLVFHSVLLKKCCVTKKNTFCIHLIEYCMTSVSVRASPMKIGTKKN